MMILHNLWRRFTRSILTILGIAVGVASVVSLGAMANGLWPTITATPSGSATTWS